MSNLFGYIVEGVLNEVSSEEAYKKWYNSIPREDFDRITGGAETFDKFIRFFLDTVKNGLSTVNDAVYALQRYKECDGLVKQTLKNKVNSGEYETAREFLADLNYLSSGGGVISRKSFAKEGLFVLGTTDNWKVTSTTNYTANNHYFGESHWCTASDRAGDYDGYQMFKRYAGDSHVYIQFTWRHKVAKKNNCDISDTDIENGMQKIQLTDESFDKRKGYNQEVIEPAQQQFQMTVDMDGDPDEICNFTDNRRSRDYLIEYVGLDAYEIATNVETIKKLREITTEQAPKESEYLEAMQEVQQERARRKKAIYNRIKQQYSDRARETNDRKYIKVKEEWDKFVGEERYKDPETLLYMLARDQREYMEQYGFSAQEVKLTEETLIKTNYVHCYNIRRCCDYGNFKCLVVSLCAIVGEKLYVNTLSRTEPRFELVTHVSENYVEGSAYVFMLFDGVNVKLIDTFVGEDLNGPYIIDSVFPEDEMHKRFTYLYRDGGGEIYLFDSKLLHIIKVKEEYQYSAVVTDGIRVFWVAGNHCPFMIYNEYNGQYREYSEDDESSDILVTDDGDYNSVVALRLASTYTIYVWNDKNMRPDAFKLPKLPSKLDYISFNRMSNRFYIEIGVVNGEGEWMYRYNVYDPSTEKFIFGCFGRDETVWSVGFITMRFKPPHIREERYVAYKMSTGEYYLIDEGFDKIEDCDKFGLTERESRAQRYLDDFFAKGGYSQDVKDQMDQMWKDREENGGDDWNRQKELGDWNDDDNPNIKGGYFDRYADNEFMKNIQSFEPTNKKFKFVGRKDPEGFAKGLERWFGDRGNDDNFKDYVGQNPWYRVDMQGRPIDQPWNTEDEIPARLSDRVVNENKIPEKLTSLWDRLGLNK